MVSIIVPAYNCIHSLDVCVRSIIAQTCTDWELILVDDGSKDGSGTLCDDFAAADPRIHVVHKENGGVSSARNAGLDVARGSYVLFCDSDDHPAPQWCELLLAAGADRPDAFPICNYYRHLNGVQSVNYEQACLSLPREIPCRDFFRLYALELLGTPWNKLFRRDILQQHGLRFSPSLSLGEDLIFNLHYMQFFSGGFTFVSQPLYHYTLGNSDSLSARYYPDLSGIYEQIFSELRAALERHEGAMEQYADGFWSSCYFAFDRVFRNTWSPRNPAAAWQKHFCNRKIFHSALFQQCRKALPRNLIHPIQYQALQTNSFLLFWSGVMITEKLSKLRHSAGKDRS